MNKNILWVIPLFSLGYSMLAEAAQADDDASPAPTNIRTAPEEGHDPATDIASITADRGIVTRPGRFTIEPSFSHAHSNSTAVAIEGYTVIPALLIGLINISEIQRDIFVGAMLICCFSRQITR